MGHVVSGRPRRDAEQRQKDEHHDGLQGMSHDDVSGITNPGGTGSAAMKPELGPPRGATHPDGRSHPAWRVLPRRHAPGVEVA